MVALLRDDHFTKIGDDLIEAFAQAPLNGAQWRIVWVVIRRTLGYQRESTTISVRDICEATKLNKSTVADELRALVRRGYLIANGDNSHAKEFGIQEDQSLWDADEGVRQSTHPTPIDAPRGVRQSAAKGTPDDAPRVRQSTHPIYKESKDNSKDKKDKTTPNGVAARGTLRQRFEADYRAASDGSKRIAVCARYFEQMLGPPNFGRVGQLLKDAGSGGALFSAMQEASKQTLTDDPHDYVATVLRNGGVRATHTGRGQTPPGTNVAASWRQKIEGSKW